MKKFILPSGLLLIAIDSLKKYLLRTLTVIMTLSAMLQIHLAQAQDPAPVQPDAGGVLYVDSAAAPGGDGSSWARALKYLSHGTRAAETNSAIREIHVAKGTYYPTAEQGDTTRDGTFLIARGGLKLYGGYPAGGGERNIPGNRTVLSGDIGEEGNSGDNSYNIMLIIGIPADADSVVVDGFTLSGGNADKTWFRPYEGLEVIRSAGAGMSIHAVGANTLIRNCVFIDNRALFGGAGMFNADQAMTTVTDCVFLENIAGGQGGAMINNQGTIVTVTNCIFSGNQAGVAGGAMVNTSTNPPAFSLITNCLFSGNSAPQAGAMYNSADSPSIINCTFSGNVSTASGGVIINISSALHIRNSVVWGNSGGITGAAAERIKYSLVQGMENDPALFNLDGDLDPLFIEAPDYHTAPFTAGDYRLKDGSPLINKGSNEALPQGVNADLDGNARIHDSGRGGIVDIGAYEFQGVCPPLAIALQPQNQTLCSGAAAVFSTEAEAGAETGSLSYQWQVSFDKGQTFIDLTENDVYYGTTSPTLTFTATPELTGLLYRALVSSECKSLTSEAALLNLTEIGITGSPPDGKAGEAYAFTFHAEGGTAPYTWSLAGGKLPPGLSLNEKSGELGGIPDVDGTFEFSIQAEDASGCNLSMPVSVQIARGNAPRITFPELQEVVYGAADFDPEAASEDGRKVVYESADENVALITPEGLISITGAGTVEITARLPELPGFEDALPVTRELLVKPALLRVAAIDDSRMYDGIAYHGGNGVTVSGWKYGDHAALLEGTVRYSGNSQGAVAAGIYEITPSGYEVLDNYAFDYVSGTLTIKPADYENISFSNAAFTFDGKAHTLTITGDLPDGASVTYRNNGRTDAGTQTVKADIKGGDNYNDMELTAELTVNPLDITVKALDQQKVYGMADPALVYKGEPALIGDDAFTGRLSRVTGETAGKYTITQGTLTAGSNYAITFEAGILTIIPAKLTVKAKDTAKVYDGTGYSGGNGLAVTGWQYDDSDALLEGTLTYTGDSQGAVSIGTYAIMPGGLSATNYEIIYQRGTLTVLPATRKLVFDPLPEKTYEDADFDPGARAHPEETILYSSSDESVATILNGKVHITGAGKTVITAALAENPNYENSPSISRELIVHKAPQTIDFFLPAEVERDAGIITLEITASSGLPVILSSSDEQVAIAAGAAGENRLEILRLGTSVITASQPGNANYLPAEPVTRQLKVVDLAGDLIKVHPVVSPNSDGINEFLLVEGIRDYPQNKMTIVNRNGVKVFEISGYDNGSRVFKGLANTVTNYEFLPQGTYFYLLEFKTGGQWKRKTGWFVMKFSDN